MPPAQPPIAGNAPLVAGQSVSGVVTASGGAAGGSVVQTHVGPISLATPSPLPSGTAVTLDVLNLPRAENVGAGGAVSNRLGQMILQSRSWPTLDEAASVLRDGSPNAAAQLMNAVLPRADAALAANIMMFLMTLRGGEVSAWFGDGPSRALKRLKPDLMNRLRDDFNNLNRMVEDRATGDWRAYPVPMANGGEIQQLHLYVQRQGEEEDDSEDKSQGPGTRFVLDLDLSRMGHLQLDGFVQDGTKRFDLIVRSASHLPTDVQNDIRTIFINVNEATGITGGLVFQSAPANFVDPLEDSGDADGVGLMV